MRDFISTMFPFFFIVLFFVTTYILSRRGWNQLAKHFKTRESFSGVNLGFVSAQINRVNYNSAIILKYNEQGLYLKPIILMRLFHPPLFIPWKEIREVRDTTILFHEMKELVIGHPQVAIICFRKKTFSKIETRVVELRNH